MSRLTNEEIDRVMSEIQNPTDLLTAICAQAKLAPSPPVAALPEEPPEFLRCDVCGWALKADGCRPDNCSMRPMPMPPSDYLIRQYARKLLTHASGLISENQRLNIKLADRRYTVPVFDCCPRCGAKDSDSAKALCKPGNDDCPMCEDDDWLKALAVVNEHEAMQHDETYWRIRGEMLDIENRAAAAEASAQSTMARAEGVEKFLKTIFPYRLPSNDGDRPALGFTVEGHGFFTLQQSEEEWDDMLNEWIKLYNAALKA